MLLRTHLAFAILIFLLIFGNIGNKILFFILLIIGTILPDIDSKKSKFGKKWYFRPLQWIFSHRGFFHTVLFGLIFFFLLYLFNIWVSFGFLTGFLIHLFLDLCTKSGVKVFWPFWERKFSLFIKTGGVFENVFFLLLCFLDMILLSKFIFN